MKTLQSAETFQRYKAVQQLLLKDEENLLSLTSQANRLDVTSGRRSQLREFEIERLQAKGRFEEMIASPPAHYLTVRRLFAQFAQGILDVFAVLSVHVNANGNLEYDSAITKDSPAQVATSEARGFSYQKMLCVCFDLALLCSFANRSFYRFVYHDGVFEALDDRRKNKMVSVVRRLIADYGIQYILTVIDSDLPRDPADNKLYFSEDEIVRELHDQGDDGRLFPGPVF